MKDGGIGQRATNENVNILLSSKEEVRCLENHHCSHLLYGQFEVKNDKKFFLDEKNFYACRRIASERVMVGVFIALTGQMLPGVRNVGGHALTRCMGFLPWMELGWQAGRTWDEGIVIASNEE